MGGGARTVSAATSATVGRLVAVPPADAATTWRWRDPPGQQTLRPAVAATAVPLARGLPVGVHGVEGTGGVSGCGVDGDAGSTGGCLLAVRSSMAARFPTDAVAPTSQYMEH